LADFTEPYRTFVTSLPPSGSDNEQVFSSSRRIIRAHRLNTFRMKQLDRSAKGERLCPEGVDRMNICLKASCDRSATA